MKHSHRQKTLSNKIEGMIHKIDIDKFIRKTLHLKKEKPSKYKMGKRGIEQVKAPSTMEAEVIEAFS